MDVDLIAVLVLVGLAVAFVIRKYARRSKGKGSACGSCNNCGHNS